MATHNGRTTMQIQYWPIERPIPYARNPRKITQAAIDKVAASIKEFGWQACIVCDTNDVIVAGHTRLLAAIKLDLKEVPVKVAIGLSPAQIKAYRIADNRTGREVEDDAVLLSMELASLLDDDYDLTVTAYSDDELQALLSIDRPDMSDEAEGANSPNASPSTDGQKASADWEKNWEGMPEFNQNDLNPWQSVKVHFANVADRDAFAKLLAQTITDKTKSIWYPKLEKADLMSVSYQSQEEK